MAKDQSLTRQKIKFFCGVIFLILFSVEVVMVVRRGGEPSYEGRNLTKWIQRYHYLEGRDIMMPEAAATNRLSEVALRAMGTNAIAFLLRWTEARSTPFSEKMKTSFNKIFPAKYHLMTMDERNEIAFTGFLIMGKDGQPAIPALIELTKNRDPNVRLDALRGLFNVETDNQILAPVLARCTNDPDKTVQSSASSWAFVIRFQENHSQEK
jgi:hypothetical protein